jgi:DnaK suppressor protein
MTKAELMKFRDVLRAKQAELNNSRGLESIAIERSADELEEADYKTAREMAIASLNRESAVRRSVESALYRAQDGSFGTCMHCESEISRRRLEAVPWAALCIRCQDAADQGDDTVLESLDSGFRDAA